MVTIRPVTPADLDTWLRMRCALWSDGSPAEHREEIEQFFAGEFPRWPWSVLIAHDDDGQVAGFAEVSVRPYAEGCESPQVGYLEGWWVEPQARGSGVGRALVSAAEDWARQRGLTEFASDAEPDNTTSIAAHQALGFEDAGLVQCFRKPIAAYRTR